jgi:C-terminal processing protease CtpA/Prc
MLRSFADGCVSALALVVSVGASVGCSGSDPVEDEGIGTATAPLRDMTAEEAAEDLEQIFTYVRTLYGPYEFKEARYGYFISDLEDEARARLADAPGDDGFYETAHWFLAKLDDGHVGLRTARNGNPVLGYVSGLTLQPVDGRALVAELDDPALADLGISFGDEVVAIDGVSPEELLTQFRELASMGNEVSNQHLVDALLNRPSYARSLRPTSPTVHVDFLRADGSDYSADLIWRVIEETPTDFASAPEQGSVLRRGSFTATSPLDGIASGSTPLTASGETAPFFVTPVTEALFDIQRVQPSEEMSAAYGLDPAALPDIYAALLSYSGKSFLLLRQSTYSVDDTEARLAYFRAVMDQYDGFVDGLLLDQTHNPGGSIYYAEQFVRLFTTQPVHNLVEAINTDRAWINSFRDTARAIDPSVLSDESRTYELRASQIEAAYDAGESLSEPFPLMLDSFLQPDDYYVWTKPMLMLIDELAGSCGDMVPALLTENGVAPLFGRRTMGLGGNVEPVGVLTHSQAELHLTRALGAVHRDDGVYATEDFIENRGVSPDVEHVIDVDDYRAGFIDYLAHASEVLAAQIDSADHADATD